MEIDGLKIPIRHKPVELYYRRGDPVLIQNPGNVAYEAIRCIKAGSLEQLLPIFSKVNRERLGALTDKVCQRMAKFMEKSKRQIGEGSQVSELRDGSARLGPGGVVALIRKEGGEAVVVSLKKEGADYTFDDVNSPSIADHESLKIVNP